MYRDTVHKAKYIGVLKYVINYQNGAFLPAWFNFNPTMDK